VGIQRRNLLNFDFRISNVRQDCKIGTVWVCCGVFVGGERMNKGNEGEGIWLMGFIYI
jgi:hypothetical protein